MKFFSILILIECLFILVLCIHKYHNIKDALKDYPIQDKRNGKQPKFVYFKMNPKAKDLDYFSKILYQFFYTIGVRPYFVNIKDNELLGIVPKDAEIDLDAVLDRFRGIIDSISIKDQM